jgi:hypothetical protein
MFVTSVDLYLVTCSREPLGEQSPSNYQNRSQRAATVDARPHVLISNSRVQRHIAYKVARRAQMSDCSVDDEIHYILMPIGRFGDCVVQKRPDSTVGRAVPTKETVRRA